MLTKAVLCGGPLSCVCSLAQIERGLRVRIKNICNNWGLDLKSVELLEITPTPTVQSAMHKQLAAERLRYVPGAHAPCV